MAVVSMRTRRGLVVGISVSRVAPFVASLADVVVGQG
jgi:hypothetical protein